MSGRTTLGLFVILILVVALAFLQSRQPEPEDAEAPTAQAPVVESVNVFEGVSVDDVARLDLALTVDASASFTREADGSWYMTTPTATQVISQTMTNTVMGLLNTGSRRTFAPDENPLDAYGLADPIREIVVAVSQEERLLRYRLEVGNETPAGDAYYVLKEGDRRVHLMMKSMIDRIFGLGTDPPLPEDLPTPAPLIP